MKKNKNIKKNKKPSFFRCVRESVKAAKSQYKSKMADFKKRIQLLNAQTDWSMLEYFIQEVNNNPKLKVDIKLGDGTVLNIETYKDKKESEYNRLEY